MPGPDTATDTAKYKVADTDAVTKKYQAELLGDGTVRVHLDEELPNISNMKNAPCGRFVWPLDSRYTFFGSLVIPGDVEQNLPPGKGVRIKGYIDLEPIDRQ